MERGHGSPARAGDLSPGRRRFARVGGASMLVGVVALITAPIGCRGSKAPATAPRPPTPSSATKVENRDAPVPAATGPLASSSPVLGPEDAPAIRPLHRCFPDLPAWVDPLVSDLLDRAMTYQEKDDFSGVLACAEEAARQAPRSVEAHHNRGLALMRLGRFDEARDALTLALAIAPDDGEALELAAELFINRLAPSAERTMVGLEYARRGRRSVAGRHRSRGARLALLEGQALVDLGRASEALAPLAVADKLMDGDSAARYEQGVALFELCRFPAARRAFEAVIVQEPEHAHALYHLGLILEREGSDGEARAAFDRASARDAKAFPPVPSIAATAFANRVRAVVASLPPEIRADLGQIPIETAEIPSVEDLTAERPPLSPTILGLYRGLPLGREGGTGAEAKEATSRGTRGRQAHDPNAGPLSDVPHDRQAESPVPEVPARAIVLYRRNILRSLHGPEELDRAIERTLLHEVGHLRGEDDGSLRDRGLE